jgi:SecD/SecF fusion protein
MMFGSGTMLSFGYTLLTGVILNFINVFLTRKLLLSILDFKQLNSLKFFLIRKEKKAIPFYTKRYIAYAVSFVVIGIGLVFGLTKGVALDTQFVGGAMIKYTYTGEVNAQASEDAALDVTGRPANVQMNEDLATNEKKMVVTLAGNKGLSPEDQSAIEQAIVKANPNAKLELSESYIVEPYIGERAMKRSALALIVSAIFIVIYVWIRFSVMSLSAGIMALIALIHDMAVVLTVFIIAGIPLNDAFVAIALTIIGYSINDTIVVYDRIRENRKMDRQAPLADLVDTSITQTFGRSINTSVTTAVCMLIIYIFSALYGIESIKVFSLPMLFGLISGCYSTICIAGPLWVSWQNRKNGKGKAQNSSATA